MKARPRRGRYNPPNELVAGTAQNFIVGLDGPFNFTRRSGNEDCNDGFGKVQDGGLHLRGCDSSL
jgi:hypothetical protein